METGAIQMRGFAKPFVKCRPSSSSGMIRSIFCPKCHGDLIENHAKSSIICNCCNREYFKTAGLIDLRCFSDRYLSLNQERRKAERLAEYQQKSTLEELARRYYSMTADVSAERRERFVRHIRDAHLRGHALLNRIPEDGKILELGCGTGGFLQAAATAGREVTGVDIASRWLVIARKRLSSFQQISKVKILSACAEVLPFSDESFDHVVADSLLEHLHSPAKAISEISRVLRPGGTLTIWSPNRYWPGPDPHVGLFGLGLMPRRWAETYIAWRRGNIYWPQLNSPKYWLEMILSCTENLELKQFSGAILSAWPEHDHSIRGRMARFIGTLAVSPITRPIMKNCGPIGEIIMMKRHHAQNHHHSLMNSHECVPHQ